MASTNSRTRYMMYPVEKERIRPATPADTAVKMSAVRRPKLESKTFPKNEKSEIENRRWKINKNTRKLCLRIGYVTSDG